MSPGIQATFTKHNALPLSEREKPLFVIDVATVKDTVREFMASMPSTPNIDVVHFGAVKACAAKPVTDVYDQLRCGFDCASKGEAKHLVDRGVNPARISLGNCNLPSNELEWGIDVGIQYYAVDSTSQVYRVLEAADRVAKRKGCSDKPFSAKFGVDPEMAFTIIEEAQAHGLTFIGLSGHPGTQNLATDAFVQFAQLFRGVFDRVKNELGITMTLANIGGGWAGISTKTAPLFVDYNKPTIEIFSYIFADWPVKLIVMTEPGRAFISKAGWLQTNVINVSKHTASASVSRVFLSVGTLHGLNEANKISFQWHTSSPSEKTKSCVLYGASCDSSDIILGKDANGKEKTVDLPDVLAPDHLVWVYGPAAYGSDYSTSFNGAPPLKVVYINSKEGIAY
ncbi:Putative ornithine decarboxylase [Fusarium oxysporum f. sp. cubense race 1]|uniref:Putative ornithine decarboxylase n=1 Tax=Fusarium oxysporum f. sp. cubense (strain race 1) TaxID=1229664 RepID=N4UVW2_FUSC1|nr:Putative ornithine decarboxylase [Fusarium oxysporum f. sp. cubense race 1]